MNSFSQRITKLESVKLYNDTNRERRILHSDACLLMLDIEDYCRKNGINLTPLGDRKDSVVDNHAQDGSDVDSSPVKGTKNATTATSVAGANTAKSNDDEQSLALSLLARCQAVIDRVPLCYVNRKRNFLDLIDEISRIVGVWLCLVTVAIFLAIPSALISPIDWFLCSKGLIQNHQRFSVLARRFIAHSILIISGISLIIDGNEHRDSTTNRSKIFCFSHSSTMDAFILSAAVNVQNFTLSKSELFMIPYFGWLLCAFGGVPVERNNRNKAVLALKAAANAAQGGDGISIAPEGTRSKTGQLLPFKKGAFYMWQELNTDIVPIVTFGAFELYPPGRQMTIPGRVVIRFLAPIKCHEIVEGISGRGSGSDNGNVNGAIIHLSDEEKRDAMSRLVRRRMLEALKHPPPDVCAPLTAAERSRNLLGLASIFTLNIVLYRLLISTGIPLKTLVWWFSIISALATFILWFYAVYVQFWFMPKALLKPSSEGKKEKKLQ